MKKVVAVIGAVIAVGAGVVAGLPEHQLPATVYADPVGGFRHRHPDGTFHHVAHSPCRMRPAGVAVSLCRRVDGTDQGDENVCQDGACSGAGCVEVACVSVAGGP